jgi:hypothetical protein
MPPPVNEPSCQTFSIMQFKMLTFTSRMIMHGGCRIKALTHPACHEMCCNPGMSEACLCRLALHACAGTCRRMPHRQRQTAVSSAKTCFTAAEVQAVSSAFTARDPRLCFCSENKLQKGTRTEHRTAHRHNTQRPAHEGYIRLLVGISSTRT